MDNKQRIIAAVMDNPAPAFPELSGTWKRRANRCENSRAGVALQIHSDGDGITVHFNHGSGRAGESLDLFDLIADRDGLAGFFPVLQYLAGAYNIPLELTPEQREQMKRAELAQFVKNSLILYASTHPDGPAAKYITQARGLRADVGEFFGELSAESLNAAKDDLKLYGKRWDAADLEALGLTDRRARAGYNVVLPYYRNGIVSGFLFRRTVPADENNPKYWAPAGTKRGGYCKRLTRGERAVIVEGELDAVRLYQMGITNVIAIGGAKPGDDLARLLRSAGIREIVYIPDYDTDGEGRRKTKIIRDALRAFQSLEIDGERVISSVEVLDLPGPGCPNGKTDADSYGRENPDTLAGMLEFEPRAAWAWELAQLKADAAGMDDRGAAVAIRDGITDIYTRTASPFDREQIRAELGRNCADWAAFGVTADALANLDEINREKDYYNRIRAAAADLDKAVQEQADPGTIAGIVRRLSDTQGTSTRAEWEAQLAQPYADELAEIINAPETLKTKWQLFRLDKTNTEHPAERIEFYPADICVFCAATSHGKTAVLFEAALDLVRNTDKTYYFVSCEENKRQLLQRALNVYLPIDTTETGRVGDADAGAYCFKRGTRKRAILAALRGADAADGYAAELPGRSEHFADLKKQITRGVEAYGRTIRPRLKFIHTEAATESICNNILHFVEQDRARGVDVGAVFVDYVQLLTTDSRNFSRTDELKEICKALKDCAARLEIPVIVAAQLNRNALTTPGGLDLITVANIGEGADVERIAHDIFLVWQTDKTPAGWYAAKGGEGLDASKFGPRARRLFSQPRNPADREIKAGFLYVEQLKARDGVTGGWGLFPFDGERGTVGENDLQTMKK